MHWIRPFYLVSINETLMSGEGIPGEGNSLSMAWKETKGWNRIFTLGNCTRPEFGRP